MNLKQNSVLFILMYACIFVRAQNCPPTPRINFVDPQFEHPGGNSNIGSNWISCGGDPSDQWGTADIQPIKPPTGVQIGVDVAPKAGNGKSYLGFFACWDRNKATEKSYNWQEIIYQKLATPMKAGITYRLAIDIMVPETRYEYDEWAGGSSFTQYTCTPTHAILRRQTKPGAITIRGGNMAGSCRGTSTILWRSQTIKNDSKWVTAEFTITPTTDYNYFIIAPEIPDEVTSAGEIRDYICIDNVRSILPDSIKTNVTHITCPGANNGTGKLILSPTANLPVDIQWSNGQKTADITNLSAGKYYVVVKDAKGFIMCDSIIVQEPTKIIVTSEHTDVTVFKGSDGTAIVSNVSGGTPPYTFQWNDPKKQTTATASNLKAGTYTCIITDKNGCKMAVTVVILEPPLFIVLIDTIQVSCFNGTDGKIVLHPSKGTAPYSYTWTPNVSSDSIAVNLKAGVYSIDVKDAHNVVVTITATIKQPDELTADIEGKDITCNGASNGEAVLYQLKGGTKPYTIVWSNGGNTDKISNLSAGTYSSNITDAHGCVLTKRVSIFEPSPLLVSHTLKNISCYGYADGTAVISANGGVKPYIYTVGTSMPGQTDSTFNNLKAGTYPYSVQDKNGCLVTGTFTLTEPPSPIISTLTTAATCNGGNDGTITLIIRAGTEPITYNWLPGNETSSSISGKPAGTYKCTIVYNGGACTTKAEAVISEPPPVHVNIDPVTICYNKDATLTAYNATGGNGAPYTYDWEAPSFSGNPMLVHPLITTTYTLVVSDAQGCRSAPESVMVTVKEKLNVIALKPQTMCEGNEAQLSAIAKGGSGNYIYHWLPEGAGTTASIKVVPLTTTVYTVTVNDDCGTPAVSDTVRITVIQKPTVEFSADIRQGCPALCIKYTEKVIAVADGIKEYTWDFGDGTISHDANPSHCYVNAGTYTVSLSVITATGCENKLVKPNYIEVYPVPVADFTFSPAHPTLLDPAVAFTDRSRSAVKWEWNFGDEGNNANINTSTVQHPNHRYADTGTYCITLKIASNKGCLAETEKCLDVIPDVTIYVPNAFTPFNKDGTNDTFYAKGTYIKTFNIWIFDRWGMLIFKSDQLNKGWSGDVKDSGIIAQEDVYVWKIVAIDYFNKKHELIGTVTLVR